MSDEPEEDRMHDLSRSVNRACERWLESRGMGTRQFMDRKRDEKAANKERCRLIESQKSA